MLEFDSERIKGTKKLYNRSQNAFLVNIDRLTGAIQELKQKQGELLKEITEARINGKPNLEAESQLVKEIFVDNPSEYSQTINVSNWHDFLRKEGRNHLRNMAFGPLELYAQIYGIDPGEIEIQRYVVLNSLRKKKNYVVEGSKALIPVNDWSQVQDLESFLEQRSGDQFNYMSPVDLIYSHGDEKWVDGRLVDPNTGELEQLVEVAEAVMFIRRVSQK